MDHLKWVWESNSANIILLTNDPNFPFCREASVARDRITIVGHARQQGDLINGDFRIHISSDTERITSDT